MRKFRRSSGFFLCVIAGVALVLASCATSGGSYGYRTAPATPGRNVQYQSEASAGGVSLQEAVEKAATEISGKLPAGGGIAVASFESESANVSDYIMEELDFALLERGLVVADRANLDSVRQELNFQASGEVSDETAQSIGHFLGVPYIATGQFRPAGNVYRFRLTVIEAERATHTAAVAFDVRNDGALRKLVETLKKSAITTHSAGY
jgi:TolB-like protein